MKCRWRTMLSPQISIFYDISVWLTDWIKVPVLLPEFDIYCRENTCVIFRLRVLGRFIHHCGNIAQTLYTYSTREAWYEIQEGRAVLTCCKEDAISLRLSPSHPVSLCRTLSRSHTCVFPSSTHSPIPLFIRHPRAFRIALSDRT